jgi:hypothetical protein
VNGNYPAALGGTNFILSWTRGDGSPTGRIGMRAVTGSVDASSNASRVAGVPLKHAVAHFSAAEQRQSANGTAVASSTLTLPSQTQITVGRYDSGSVTNGYITRIRILPTAITDARLQALTAP